MRASDTVSHEEVQVHNMAKHHYLAKSSADAGWSAFLAILNLTAAPAGRAVVAVDPACTSQVCSGCGARIQTGLSVRPACLPGRRHEPAAGPERRQDDARAPSSAVGGRAGLPAGLSQEPEGLPAPRGVSGLVIDPDLNPHEWPGRYHQLDSVQ